MVRVLHTGHLLHIPVWQEGILGVLVDGVGHVSAGLIGEQVHHTGGGTIMTHEQYRGFQIFKKGSQYSLSLQLTLDCLL